MNLTKEQEQRVLAVTVAVSPPRPLTHQPPNGSIVRVVSRLKTIWLRDSEKDSLIGTDLIAKRHVRDPDSVWLLLPHPLVWGLPPNNQWCWSYFDCLVLIAEGDDETWNENEALRTREAARR